MRNTGISIFINRHKCMLLDWREVRIRGVHCSVWDNGNVRPVNFVFGGNYAPCAIIDQNHICCFYLLQARRKSGKDWESSRFLFGSKSKRTFSFSCQNSNACFSLFFMISIFEIIAISITYIKTVVIKCKMFPELHPVISSRGRGILILVRGVFLFFPQ